MKKIGIVTLFENSINYGGVLQAYALCEALNQKGIDAEQIRYRRSAIISEYEDRKIRRIIAFLPNIHNIIIDKIYARKKKKQIHNICTRKEAAFVDFRDNIVKHSKSVYTVDTLKQANDIYDIFITGSDQVWNGYDMGLYLDFVEVGKKKISYAASISRDRLNKRLQKKMYESLKTYDAISVREENDKKLLMGSNLSIQVVMDPVFLLEKNKWVDLAAKRLIKEKYIFCYFLGSSLKERELAYEMSKKTGYRLIQIPMYRFSLYKADYNGNAENIIDASPRDFLSLILHAEYVFTDSFHATAFSIIFNKDFFVFYRDSMRKMGSRIKNITIMTGTEERFCDSKEKTNIKYITTVNNINYSCVNDIIKVNRKKSFDYLYKNLDYYINGE